MSIESPHDLAGLKEIGGIVARVLQKLRTAVKPGVTTADLDAIADDEFAASGAESSPRVVYKFPGATCISVNDEVVHGVPGSRKLVAGDIVKLDVTAQKNGYVADACISVPVGEVSDESRRLISAAERAFRKAMRVASAGRRVNEIGAAVENEIRRSGFHVVRELCGHGVGRTIHEEPQVPNHFDPRANQVLSEGLVITVEPIIAAGNGHVHQALDGWTVKTDDHARSAHFEHTIVITRNEPVILTA
jgi:methionyl aminopeptidase